MSAKKQRDHDHDHVPVGSVAPLSGSFHTSDISLPHLLRCPATYSSSNNQPTLSLAGCERRLPKGKGSKREGGRIDLNNLGDSVWMEVWLLRVLGPCIGIYRTDSLHGLVLDLPEHIECPIPWNTEGRL